MQVPGLRKLRASPVTRRHRAAARKLSRRRMQAPLVQCRSLRFRPKMGRPIWGRPCSWPSSSQRRSLPPWRRASSTFRHMSPSRATDRCWGPVCGCRQSRSCVREPDGGRDLTLSLHRVPAPRSSRARLIGTARPGPDKASCRQSEQWGTATPLTLRTGATVVGLADLPPSCDPPWKERGSASVGPFPSAQRRAGGSPSLTRRTVRP
jgi:hypothetical protein